MGKRALEPAPVCLLSLALSPASPRSKTRGVGSGRTSARGPQRNKRSSHLSPARSPAAAARSGRSRSSAGEPRSRCEAGTSHPRALRPCAAAASPAPPAAAGAPLESRRATRHSTRSLGAGALGRGRHRGEVLRPVKNCEMQL